MTWLARTWNGAMRVTTGVAWLFAVGSMLALTLSAWMLWPGPGSVVQIMGVDLPGGGESAWIGFRYTGAAGMALLLVELALAAAATIATVLPWARPRRAGHVALVVWAGWWLVGAIYAWRWEPRVMTFVVLVAMVAGAACTVVRAVRGWRSGAAVVATPAPA